MVANLPLFSLLLPMDFDTKPRDLPHLVCYAEMKKAVMQEVYGLVFEEGEMGDLEEAEKS